MKIILKHPRGQVSVTVESDEEVLERHVTNRICEMFNVKKETTFEDIFREFDGLFGKKK